MSMKKIAHRISSIFGFILILCFLTSTIVSEVFGELDTIAIVKRFILYGIFVLVPTMMISGISGKSLAGSAKHPLMLKKLNRMKLIGFNAIMILIPSAIVLYYLSNAGYWGNWFIAVQAIEIIAGIMNVILMLFNIRDGIKLKKLRSKALPI
jgi:hypothetical protein